MLCRQGVQPCRRRRLSSSDKTLETSAAETIPNFRHTYSLLFEWFRKADLILSFPTLSASDIVIFQRLKKSGVARTLSILTLQDTVVVFT